MTGNASGRMEAADATRAHGIQRCPVPPRPGGARSTPQPWRGAVLLDSAALDVAALLQQRHLPLYDRAFVDIGVTH